MSITIRLSAMRQMTVRRGAAAAVVAAGLGLGGAAQGAPPPGVDPHAPPSLGGVPGSPDALESAGTPGQSPMGVHDMGGGKTGRGVDVDPVSPGGLGSGISTNTEPSATGAKGSVGSTTTASPTSR